MNFNPPKKTTVYLSMIVAVLGLVAFFVPAVSAFAFWVLLVGYLILVAGLLLKGF